MIYVFYADRLYAEYATYKEYRAATTTALNYELYQGGYVYDAEVKGPWSPWFRCDGTPVLLEDVPKTLQTCILLMF